MPSTKVLRLDVNRLVRADDARVFEDVGCRTQAGVEVLVGEVHDERGSAERRVHAGGDLGERVGHLHPADALLERDHGAIRERRRAGRAVRRAQEIEGGVSGIAVGGNAAGRIGRDRDLRREEGARVHGRARQVAVLAVVGFPLGNEVGHRRAVRGAGRPAVPVLDLADELGGRDHLEVDQPVSQPVGDVEVGAREHGRLRATVALHAVGADVRVDGQRVAELALRPAAADGHRRPRVLLERAARERRRAGQPKGHGGQGDDGASPGPRGRPPAGMGGPGRPHVFLSLNK